MGPPPPPLFRRRPWLVLAVVALGVLVLGGCAAKPKRPPPRFLTSSPAWQRSVDPDVFRQRLAALTDGLTKLRAETHSSWVGRQDDVTGYLAELKGGRSSGGGSDPKAVVAALFDAYGRDLFGVDASALALGNPDRADPSGAVVIRGTQRVGAVPVLDGAMTITVVDAASAPAVSLVQGRVFPGIKVPTDPVISRDQAVRTAKQAAGGGSLIGDASLVVVPVGAEGALAWEVKLQRTVGSSVQIDSYYVDAVRGGVLTVRSVVPSVAVIGTTIQGLRAAAGDVPTGEDVAVAGTGPNGQALTAHGIRTADGKIFLVDTATESFDPSTGNGGIQTHDGRSAIPGPIVTSTSADISDPEAIAAHAFSRYIYDYYLQVHGRDSWDGKGVTMVSSIHVQEGCNNAYFNGEQMVYFEPCVEGGQATTKTLIDIDVTAHEITHGVTQSTSDLLYSAQSGAMNESFSDYFGNVVGDRFHGTDSDAIGEDACQGITGDQGLCSPLPNGGEGVRYMVGGETIEDYLLALTPPYIFHTFDMNQDNGGVHLNSFIWNNALWSIRKQLATLDGSSMLQSPRAQQFDAIVYSALTRHLTPTSGFLDGRTAVEQAAQEQAADATTLRVITETFDRSEICSGCGPAVTLAGNPVATTSDTEFAPAVSGDRAAWIAGLGLGKAEEQASPAGQTEDQTAAGAVYSIGFNGDALVAAQAESDSVVQIDASGAVVSLDGPIKDERGVGVAGSEAGAAWVNFDTKTLNFVDSSLAVQSAPLPTGIGSPVSIGTGGGTVAVGTERGEVVAWTPGSAPQVFQLGSLPVLSVDADGGRVAAVLTETGFIDAPSAVFAIDVASGKITPISATGFWGGVTIAGDYLVWSQIVGTLPGKIAAVVPLPDSNLYLYSFATGQTYQLVDEPGQQAFPSLSGRRLVWQDSVNQGNDIYSAQVPEGL